MSDLLLPFWGRLVSVLIGDLGPKGPGFITFPKLFISAFVPTFSVCFIILNVSAGKVFKAYLNPSK